MITLALEGATNALDTSTTVEPLLFFVFAGLTAICAWTIVFSQNIVRMCLYLLFSLLGVAGLYFILSAEILAAVQLIVYAGGTLILIVFGVMLTSKNPKISLAVQPWEKFVAVGVSLVLLAMLLLARLNSTMPLQRSAEVVDELSKEQVRKIGVNFLDVDGNLIIFELVAVLLLAVMIGAAFMARRRAGIDE